jgi:hypothetical protein
MLYERTALLKHLYDKILPRSESTPRRAISLPNSIAQRPSYTGLSRYAMTFNKDANCEAVSYD